MKRTIDIKSWDELTKSELYALLQLRERVFIVEQNCAYADLDGNDRSSFHLLMHDADRMIAYLRILPPGVIAQDRTSIGRVVVDQEYRGQSLGNKIMYSAINFARAMWQSDIEISAQSYTLDFYSAMGFEAKGDPYLEDGIAHQKMLLPYTA